MGIAQHYTSSAHSGDKKAGMQNRATPPTSPTDVAGRPRPGPTNGRAFPGPDARATRQRQRRQHGWLRFVGVAASHPRPSGEAVRLGDCGLPVCCRRQATAAVLYLSPISLLASAHPLPTAPPGGGEEGGCWLSDAQRPSPMGDGRWQTRWQTARLPSPMMSLIPCCGGTRADRTRPAGWFLSQHQRHIC